MFNILVIDDEEMIRSLAEKILQRDSHTVFTAENGLDAISLYKENQHTIDIIIVDMNLDDMSGIEIIAEIKKLSPEIPCVISSGNSYNENDIPEELNHNIHFLQKPYRAAVLTELVHGIVVTS